MEGDSLYLPMNHYTIRHATEADIPTMMGLIDHSRMLMRADGNTVQWVGYPTRAGLLLDVERQVSYLMLDGNEAVGTFALVPGDEPTYAFIDHGRWIDTSTPYATLHRIAKAEGRHGIAAAAFAFAKSAHTHLRIDTHASNRPMRHVVGDADFIECGVIYMPDGSPRLAYEWWRWDEVQSSLQEYVSREVLPRYDSFDCAHRRDHALRVIARSMTLYRHLRERLAPPTAPIATLMPELVYAAAAMHDLGLVEGRDEHHLASGRIVRNCRELRCWFDENQVEIIAQAVEDHRASASMPPRSVVGRIVAEADRDVEPERIVRRTVDYSLSHYPTLDREGHWRRTLGHLNEKYAAGGYIKLWLADSPNAAPLAELRALIADEPRLRQLFDSIINNNKMESGK